MESHSLLFLSAGILILVALIHSILGEYLIFKRMRVGKLVPTQAQPILRERYVRILWATWHMASLLGLSIAIIFIQLGTTPEAALHQPIVITACAGLAASSALVFFATKGMHPGWAGLLIAAALAAFSI